MINPRVTGIKIKRLENIKSVSLTTLAITWVMFFYLLSMSTSSYYDMPQSVKVIKKEIVTGKLYVVLDKKDGDAVIQTNSDDYALIDEGMELYEIRDIKKKNANSDPTSLGDGVYLNLSEAQNALKEYKKLDILYAILKWIIICLSPLSIIGSITSWIFLENNKKIFKIQTDEALKNAGCHDSNSFIKNLFSLYDWDEELKAWKWEDEGKAKVIYLQDLLLPNGRLGNEEYFYVKKFKYVKDYEPQA